MADCINCGGVLKFDIEAQMLYCESCGGYTDPYKLDDSKNDAKETDAMGVTVFTCQSCGGEIYSTDHDLSGVCSYCGSNVVFSSRMQDTVKPSKIVTFKITKEDCKKAYINRLKQAHFVPKSLMDEAFIDGFRGIYMPYQSYKVTHDGNFMLYQREHYTKGSYTIQDTYRVTGEVNAEYGGMVHDVSSCFSDDLSERVEPFLFTYKDKEKNKKKGKNVKAAKEENSSASASEKKARTKYLQPFTASFLSGFYAEPADTDPKNYYAYVSEKALNFTDESLEKEKYGASRSRNVSVVGKVDMFLYDTLSEAEAKIDDQMLSEISKPGKSSAKEKEAKRLLYENYKAQKKLAEEVKAARKAYNKEKKKYKGLYLKNEHSYGYSEHVEASDLYMLPVWFLSYKNGNRVAYATVNGQTGRISSDIPIDFKKCGAFAGIVAVIAFLLLRMVILRPIILLSFAVWFTYIVMRMLRYEGENIYDRKGESEEERLRVDKSTDSKNAGIWGLVIIGIVVLLAFVWGWITGESAWTKNGFWVISAIAGTVSASIHLKKALKSYQLDRKAKGITHPLIPFAAILLGMATIIIRPVSDIYYYGATVVQILVASFCMGRLLLAFNHNATSELPQFNHKGGNDNA